MPPENINENEEAESNDPNIDEKENASEEDDSDNPENPNVPDVPESEKDDTDNQKETAQSDDAVDPEAKEDVEKSEQSTLDETSTHDAQVQPMDVDNNVNESADKVRSNISIYCVPISKKIINLGSGKSSEKSNFSRR